MPGLTHGIYRTHGGSPAYHNMVVIALAILKYKSLSILHVWPENAYSRPSWGCFGGKNMGKLAMSEFLSLYENNTRN